MINYDHYNPQSFDWLNGFQTWGIVCGLLFLGALVLGLVFQVLSHWMLAYETHVPGQPRRGLIGSLGRGISNGIVAFFAGLVEGFRDLCWMSPRRVGAMSVLVFRESVRRRTLLVLVVFGILFLFAGWFLHDPTSDQQMRIPIYVAFVLTAISWLILPAVFLLACWGLPDDIKARSLHTVVTKPVRRSEILVGRIMGVTLVGTLVLACMSVVGYLWLVRALPEVRGMQTRVPVFGELAFLDREGKPADAGINTGDIDMFRSYIEGDTGARAIWKFTGVTPQLLNKEGRLLIESKIQGFRTHKGNIEKRIICQFTFWNPTRNIRAKYQPFEINEFRESIKAIEPDLFDEQNRPVKLMTDLVDNKQLTVEVACLSTGQFLGMARPDVFIRAQDAPFIASFFKAVFCIWLMMVLIIVFSVSVSTIVKGPIAAFLTGVNIILGIFGRDFMLQLTDEKRWKAGGILESGYRIVKHMNPEVEMEKGLLRDVLKTLDYPMLQFAGRSRALIADFNTYQMAKVVADGYDVPWSSAVLPAIMLTLAFLVPCVVLGYYCLKSRELESK